MAMTQREWKIVGIIAAVLAGLGISVLLGNLISGIPAGGVILAVLLIAAAVLTGIGRWSASAPPWIATFSRVVTRSPAVTCCVACMLVIASFKATTNWVQEMDQEERAEVAAEQAQTAAAVRAVEEKARREAEAKAAAEAATAAVARFEKLRSSAAENATRFRNDMQAVEDLIAQGRIDQAGERAATLAQEVAEYRTMDQRPAVIDPILAPVTALENRVNRIAAIQRAAHDLDAYKGQAEGMTDGGNDSSGWAVVIDLYQKALDQIVVLEGADDEGRRFVPAGLNLGRERKAIEGRMKTAQRKHDKAKETESRAELYAALCGDPPTRSSWDGEVLEVTFAVKKVAHDPDSIEVESCTPPVLSKKDCWVTTCNVRGKNAFGALVLNQKTFSVSKLGVSEL